MNGKLDSSTITQFHKQLRMLVILGMLFGLLVPLFQPSTASAASVTSATFTGGTGTFTAANGTLYAKEGASLTLTVRTSSDTQCVDVAGAFTGTQASAAKASWTFSFTAGSGDGEKVVTVTASPNVITTGTNAGKCTGSSGSAQASFTLDNTGPVVTPALSPAPNGMGWNNANVTVTWTATDAGSGVAAAQPFQTDTVTAGTTGVSKTATAIDRLENSHTGSVTVKLDKQAPLINPTLSPEPNTAGWNNGPVTVSFTCSDALSGIKSCTGGGTVVVSTEGANQSVPGTAVDNADNTNNAGVTGINIDLTKPTLTGTPTTRPNANGWYNSDVTIRWTCSDALSGIALDSNGNSTCPADGTLTGEGRGMTLNTGVLDKAGNSAIGQSSPAVQIDQTAPTTGISGTSNNWTNDNVTVSLSARDNLSGVASTSYTINGGPVQTGTSFTLSTEGDHTVTFFSTDNAGNAEAVQTARVKIDKTAPTISHAFTPPSYENGAWTNRDVTVTFTCADQGGSGVAGCTAPVTKSVEGSHTVIGTATDAAGNSATDNASVRIDKTAPTITATAGGTKNAAGWYKDDVTVTYTANDELSGISGTPANDVLGEGENQSASATVTDAAGNSSSAGVTGINVDKTAPRLTGTPSTTGWSTNDVTVSWACSDALSGIAAGDCPAASTVTGAGTNLSASATVSDVAGNITSETVSGIKIDRQPPATSARPDREPLASGWYAGAVQITLTGQDALSGVVKTQYRVDDGPDQTYNGAFSFDTEGEHTISFWSTDVAGNIEVAGDPLTLKVDKTAPTTTLINPISPATGWFVTSGVPFAFRANDAHSGIKATYYAIDGGDPQTYGEPFTADLSSGSHSVTYWSEDNTGNVEAQRTFELSVDTDAPTISGADVNDTTWRNTPLSQSFTASDALSGLANDADASFVLEASAQSADANTPTTVSKTVADKAGNTSTRTLSAKIDLTAPAISGPDVNDTTWRNTPLSQGFTASDALSGLANDADASFALEASAQSADANTPTTVSKAVADNAGNSSMRTLSAKIDLTAPEAPTFSGIAATTYTTANVPAQDKISCTATDGLSGFDSCTFTGYNNAAGTHTLTATARDKAGNTSTNKLTYTVASPWTLKGFYAPIGETNSFVRKPGEAAPTAGSTTVWQTAKGGSAIPLKFEVFINDVESTSTTDIKGFAATKLSSCTGTINDLVEETVAGAGSSILTYSDGQFIQVWKTGAVTTDTCYRVAMNTNDGSAIYTFVKLRK